MPPVMTVTFSKTMPLFADEMVPELLTLPKKLVTPMT